MFVINYIEKFLKLNHELCLKDPLQEEFKIHNVWIDFTLIIVFFACIVKTFRKTGVYNMSSKNKSILKGIRYFGAIAGLVYLIIAYYIERCTLARFIMSRPRFLTENFILYFAAYYVCISLWELSGRNPSNKFFNVWFNSLIIGTALVTLGFWFLVAPYGILYLDVRLRWVDLLGHFVNLIWVLIEWKNLSNHNISECSLFVVLFLISCYSCLIWFYQKIELMCWVPYGPILPNVWYRMAGILGIMGLYFVVRYLIKK